ncbi:MAG: hypothetical protein WC325_02930 [Candidatus Bathyarchaeia archaeon]|jgi:hypothetical protein
MSFYEKYRFLQEYLDLKGFTCYPKEFEITLQNESLRYADFAAYKDGHFWAFEYKSFGDWIGRGIEQCERYAEWFDYVVLVVERNLTRKSKFFKQIKENGFGLLWRKIDGPLTWKLDPKPQNPSHEKVSYVDRKFKSVPYFRKFIGEFQFESVPKQVYRKLQEKQAEAADDLISRITNETMNLYISICHVGTMLEPQSEKLITYSTKPINFQATINTSELEKWLTNPEIVYIAPYPGDDERWNELEKYLSKNTLTVGELLTQKDRVPFMAYNVARDLIYCKNNDKTFRKNQVIKEILKKLRKKKV